MGAHLRERMPSNPRMSWRGRRCERTGELKPRREHCRGKERPATFNGTRIGMPSAHWLGRKEAKSHLVRNQPGGLVK